MTQATYTTTGVFDGYTLAEIRALVLRFLRVSNTTRFSSDSGTATYDWIDDAINRGQETFVRETLCLRNYAVIELAANQRLYRLPGDFLDLMACYYYDSALDEGYKELTINTIEELNDEISDWRTGTGTPSRLYIDRNYGQGLIFGLYPIPDTDGDTVTFDSEYGSLVTWVCPLYTFNTDYGTIIKATGTDEYLLSSQSGITVDITPNDGNLLIEYYCLPYVLAEHSGVATMQSDIPREYQRAITYHACYDLLISNPMDSEEWKRGAAMYALYEKEVKTYINKRKRSLAGRQLKARPAVWNWQQNMAYYKELP